MSRLRIHHPREDKIIRLIEEHKFAEACDEIYKIYMYEIKRQCANGLREVVKDPDGAGEELAHDILREFFKKIEEFNPDIASVRTVLFKLTTQRLIDKRRLAKNKLEKQSVIKHEFDPRDFIDPNAPNPEEIYYKEEFLKLFDLEVGKLAEIDRIIINLMRRGYSTAEIADIVNKREGYIRRRLHEVKKPLQTALRQDYYAHELGFRRIHGRYVDEETLQYFETHLYSQTSNYRIYHYVQRIRRRLDEFTRVLLMRK